MVSTEMAIFNEKAKTDDLDKCELKANSWLKRATVLLSFCGNDVGKEIIVKVHHC